MKIDKDSYERRGPGAPPLPGGTRNHRIDVRLYPRLKAEVDKALAVNVASSANQLIVDALEEKLGVRPDGAGEQVQRFLPLLPYGVKVMIMPDRSINMKGWPGFSLGGFAEYVDATKGEFMIEVKDATPFSPELKKVIPLNSILLMKPSRDAEGQRAMVTVTTHLGQIWCLRKYSSSDLKTRRPMRFSVNGGTFSVSTESISDYVPLAVIDKIFYFGDD